VSAAEPGVARSALRRVKAASGLGDLDELEARVEIVQVAVAENRALDVPLAALLSRIEGSLVPLLASRLDSGDEGEPQGA